MSKINGYLHTQGRKIVDGNNEEIILKGWGLGNWLLPEGYMWLADGGRRFDRPRRIEQVIGELTGKAYAEHFWKSFRENYITREDIRYMAELGYNSVRIPINWRVLMEDGEEIRWKEEGFELLDRCVNWCEEEGMYAFLDLHGAPGGQTGANIDDSLDDVPRLFIDADKKEKCLALWHRLAVRYKDREAVGGYDLLNEPICPPDGGRDNDYLIPQLARLYRELIADIRTVDQKHLLSIEGAHWATDLRIFTEPFDDNMVLHFHRYAEMPQRSCLDAYVKKAEELDIPLWMGETGENSNEWYAAFYPLSVSMGIGYNLWPWKKMACTNSPCSIRAPKDYDLVIAYTNGGPHPGYAKSRAIFDEYLENIRLENCDLHPEVTRHVFRKAPFSLMAVDFDEFAENGQPCSGTGAENPAIAYRRGCGMRLEEVREAKEKQFAFDSQWDRYALSLGKGEFARYTLEGCGRLAVEIEADVKKPAVLRVSAGGAAEERSLEVGEGTVSISVDTEEGVQSSVCITAVSGEIYLKKLHFRPV